jgi:type II secretory pathway pseudopilin PulG
MEDIAANVIAVLGTLLGVGLTYLFQQRGTSRSERLARAERLRQERLDAYCGYAGALVNYRRSLMDRWFCDYEQRPADQGRQAREASYQLRSEAQEALFRVRMLTAEPDIARLAESALEQLDDLHHAEDRPEFDHRREITRDLINTFLTTARPIVTPP